MDKLFPLCRCPSPLGIPLRLHGQRWLWACHMRILSRMTRSANMRDISCPCRAASKLPQSSSVNSTAVTTYLQGLGLDVDVPSSIFPVYKSNFKTRIYVLDPTIYVFNHTTQTLPSDGSVTFAFISCTTGCTEDQINIVSIYPNYTGIPTLQFTAPSNSYELAFLVCKPNITIETREVRTQGSFILDVQPLPEGKPYPRFGSSNINMVRPRDGDTSQLHLFGLADERHRSQHDECNSNTPTTPHSEPYTEVH
ncbi:hypothetical protein M405DRAFT_70997 [Rhizopogon salebrosus TDB-379]|nr:hypothetical protein M405DRAFT_70997 [Rhizopogon salebrosus TDB-379]